MDVKTSKFLSLVLRHRPETIGIKLDRNGWTPVDELIRRVRKAGRPLDEASLAAIVAENPKKRFTLSADGRMIRAAQGHSLDVDLALEPATPPDVLFHGTARDNLDSIFRDGLLPGRRRHVHLSPDAETAESVGRRHGRPVVLTVDCAALVGNGAVFLQADNGVWLTDRVPPSAIAFAGPTVDAPAP